MPAPDGSGRDALTANAYEQFWACWDNDAPSGDAPHSTDAADAYHQFWQQADL